MRHRDAMIAIGVLALGTLTGCSRGRSLNPAAPTAEANKVALTLVAARSGQPVPGATVEYQSTASVTDASGTVLVLSQSAVTVRTYEGFVTPSVLTVNAALTHGLWPDDAQMPYSWIMRAVYGDEGTSRLIRQRGGSIAVEFSQEAQSDRWAGPAAVWAVDAINRAQQHVQFVASGPGSPVRVYRDPDDPILRSPGYENAWAIAIVTLQGDTIVGGRIVFKFWTDNGNSGTRDRIQYAIAHELGHIYGLGHPPGGIMGSSDATDFSSREREMMELMFLRPPGNRAPDDSSGVVASAGRVREMVVCVR